MTDIADQLDRLAERGPHADPRAVVAGAIAVAVVDEPPSGARRSRPLLATAAALVIVAGAVALAVDRARNAPSPVVTSPTETSGPAPAADRLVMRPSMEAFPDSIVASNETLVQATSLVSVTHDGEQAHLFLYEVRGDGDVVSRCTAVTGTGAEGSSCAPIESGKPDPVVRTTIIDRDRATVTIEAPAETEIIELHLADRTIEVVPVDGWAVVPAAASEVCPTFTATAHLSDGTTVEGTSPTRCFS